MIELSHKLAPILNQLELEWPDINEDNVQLFGSYVRKFGDELAGIHLDASISLKRVAEICQALGIAQLTHRADDRVAELWGACQTTADTFDTIAFMIAEAKSAVIQELIAVNASMGSHDYPYRIANAREKVASTLQELEHKVIPMLVSETDIPVEQSVNRLKSELTFIDFDELSPEDRVTLADNPEELRELYAHGEHLRDCAVSVGMAGHFLNTVVKRLSFHPRTHLVNAARSFIGYNFHIECYPLSEPAVYRTMLDYQAPFTATDIQRGFLEVLRTRELSTVDYDFLTEYEFETEDDLYSYLAGIYQAVFVGAERMPDLPPNS